jgi:hypothetical protein
MLTKRKTYQKRSRFLMQVGNDVPVTQHLPASFFAAWGPVESLQYGQVRTKVQLCMQHSAACCCLSSCQQHSVA